MSEFLDPVTGGHDLHAAPPGGPPQGALCRDSVPDRRVRRLNALGGQLGFGDLVELTVEGEVVLGPGLGHQVEGFLEASHPLLPRNPVSFELLRDVTGSHPEDEAALGEIVENCDVLGELQRCVERDQEHPGSDAHVLGHRCHARAGDQRARTQTVFLGVVGDLKGRAVAEVFSHGQATEHVLVGLAVGNSRTRRILVGEEQSEAHGSS